MTFQSWVNKVNGRSIDEDGAYGYQCWDLSANKARLVDGCKPFSTGNGAAAGSFYNFPNPLPRYYRRVVNNPNNPNQLPPVGSIIFWKYSLPGSGGYGHTALVLSRNLQSFVSLDQNWNGAYAHKVRHNWNYIAGWFVRK